MLAPLPTPWQGILSLTSHLMLVEEELRLEVAEEGRRRGAVEAEEEEERCEAAGEASLLEDQIQRSLIGCRGWGRRVLEAGGKQQVRGADGEQERVWPVLEVERGGERCLFLGLMLLYSRLAIVIDRSTHRALAHSSLLVSRRGRKHSGAVAIRSIE